MKVEYMQSSDVEAVEMDGEWILLNLNDHKVTKLNGIGGYIWNLVKNRMTAEEMVKSIQKDYEVSAETAKRDLLNFLDKLTEIGLVAVCKTEDLSIY